MSWKSVVLTTDNKPAPAVKVAVKDNRLRMYISPEIAMRAELVVNGYVNVFVGSDADQGMIKIVPIEEKNEISGRLVQKDGKGSLTVNIPTEQTWVHELEATRCDYETNESEKGLVVTLPWFAEQNILRGNTKLSLTQLSKIVAEFCSGTARRDIAKTYNISDGYVYTLTRDYQDQHDEALLKKRVAANLGSPAITHCPPRNATGLRKR